MALQIHIFFFPLMAPGHINPMVDLARILAEGGVKVTVLTTPSNAPLLRPTIDKAQDSGLQINLHVVRFPSSEAGLPEGHESLLSLPSPQITAEFFTALELLCQSLDPVLREHRPDCIIFDSYLPSMADVAHGLDIPSLVFQATGLFPLCVLDSFCRHVSNGGNDTVLIPGLPHRIEMKKSQLPNLSGASNEFTKFMGKMVEAELKTCGVIVNSFYAMEPDYVDHYRDVMGRKAWLAGPVSLCNRARTQMAGRGARFSSASCHESIMKWLDSNPPISVVYVCFGSLCRMTETQLHEIALGLEVSNHPFIWVVRDDGLEGYDVRVVEKGKGLIVRGWAPQMLVLNHRAIGAFVTHCGWNSVMEGVSAGVPMITWPLFAEQFYNEKLVVDVLGVGVSVGVEVWSMREEEKPVVTGEQFGRAVAWLMDGGEEADGARRRASELSVKARKAVEEGGSSHADVGRLIELLVGRVAGKKKKTLR